MTTASSQCPKCHYPDIYRRDPRSLTVYCSKCGHSWQSNQTLRALLRVAVYRTRAPRGNHDISVWHCPIDSSKYSFSVTFGAGVSVFNQFEGHPYDCGQFNTPEEALEAGIKWVKED
ncbi:hypothetical protein [Floridanema aerugineum]|uniref:Uncharacterized protein n=1 Tax=Floridaenema aerugineum BLCC-F46 TaxID=3153654 RepID=A0ABV4X938_9CYAN